MTYTLHNSGNAAISAQPATHLSGPFGMFGMDAPAVDEVHELLPGESWTQTVTLPGVAPLFALLASTTVTPLVLDASGSTSPIADVSGTAGGPAIPWTLLVIVLLVAVGVFFLLRTRGARKKSAEKRREAEVDAAVAKALEQERAKAGVAAEQPYMKEGPVDCDRQGPSVSDDERRRSVGSARPLTGSTLARGNQHSA